METFETSPWTNGSPNHKTGSGFGIRIPIEVYRALFRKSWDHVVLLIDGNEFEVPISPSFWNKCHELRSKSIGQWLIKHGRNKWPSMTPPRITVTYQGNNRFKLSLRGRSSDSDEKF